jgi:predicted nucleotidyltransferase
MYFEFIVDLAKRYKEYRDRWMEFAKEIKGLAEEFFGGNFSKLCVFGSTVRGDYKPLSDIDVAVVLKEGVDEWARAKFRSLVSKRLGACNPFEVHVVTEREWREWYMKFVKGGYVEV